MVTLRAPSSLPATEASASISPPQLSWLSGSWNVTHSTLPMWKKNRNVRITYTPVASTTPPQIDDVVTYQGLNSDALKTVHGVDKPFDVPNTAPPAGAEGGAGDVASLGYNWRGKGWLVIATSKWEILGYGDEQGTGNSWVVTYFAKTLFTPAGIDFYSRKGSLAPQTINDIKAALAGLGGDVAKLAGQIFEVKMDADTSG
ncbi:hypothetical protein COCCADRAFT_27672 [Bipolaris zeicola 26-R-13]|uniref:Uncharacterized protein n=1 Tax=Cochliobolus carbonum (strain 26-R-13) TaxID=930089 RepID=W6Y149_COCC2|nr:uncharacterized protein COCCADRAFT_27672 [Bipolaris zeicola 26-R-13]EUC31663.1 hypothetical protein COCCADRAFT_27672 [Bipolaris zeicola 26-R-13]